MQNFQGFKKIGSDKKSTTFAHPSGHQLTVAHASLDPKTLQKMSALPVHKACGGEMKKYAGNENRPEDSEVNLDIDPNAPMPAIPAQIQGSMAPSSEFLANPTKSSSTPVMDAIKYGNKWLMAPAGTTPPPTVAQAAPEEEAAPTNVNLNPPAQTQNNMLIPQPGNGGYDPYQGLNTQAAGVKAEANAIGSLEKQKAKIFQQNQKDMLDIQNQGQQNAWNNNVETQNMIDDMRNSHIDPKAYINNMSGGQKASTAIGLLLGGMAGGILHTGGNAAMDFLNKQIDRDIEAQKGNIENKKTIFNALQTQYRNTKDATDMTRAFYLSKLQNDISTAAAKAGSPLAQARAQQALGPIQTQIQQLHFQVGMRQAALNTMKNGGNAAAALPYLVQDSSKVSEAAKAYGAANALNDQQRNIMDSFNQIRGKFMNGVLSPNDTASAKQAFIGNLQVALEHRYNPDAAAALGNSLFPTMTDTESTVNNKAVRLQKEFDGARAEHDATLRALTSGMVGAPAAPPVFNKRK